MTKITIKLTERAAYLLRDGKNESEIITSPKIATAFQYLGLVSVMVHAAYLHKQFVGTFDGVKVYRNSRAFYDYVETKNLIYLNINTPYYKLFRYCNERLK